MNELDTKYFKKLVKEKLSDKSLRTIVKKATFHSLQKRNETIQNDISEKWEQLREKAYSIRKITIENWDYYFNQIKAKFSENGIDFFYAKNSSEVCDIVNNLLFSYKAKNIVKSKSMVTEEVGLNEYLEKFGFIVTETDLGEYIIQLANERPSHITAPALHKSRSEIGFLFSEKLNIDYTDAPEKLTDYARQILRKKFLNADVGISGANFLVAETGTIVIVENEGNARLTITLPKLHIVITSIEKIVPTLSDALILLRLLPVSSTGQKITSYVSFINKPEEEDNSSKNLKKIVVILLDNGRSKLISDKKLRSILYCIKCGACMNKCPVYQLIGGHAYGSVYPGPIGSILTPWLNSFKDSKDLAYGSSLCGACSEICPVKIDIHYQLLRIRKYSIEKKFSPFIEKIIFKIWLQIVKNYKIYNLLSNILCFLGPLFQETGLKIPVWSKYKYFPAPFEFSFHKWWQREVKTQEEYANV